MYASSTDESDYNISANSAVIEVGRNMVCIGVQAVDDMLIEGEESITVTATSNNNFDTVSGSTAVTITDNNGMLKLIIPEYIPTFFLPFHSIK